MVVVARAAVEIELSEEEERHLRAVLRTPSASQQQALRARIVLRAAEGASNTQIAAEAGVSLPTVGLWRRSFFERGLDGLQDAPRSGRPREIDDDEVQRVLAMTLEPPPDGSTHWSVRRLAAATGLSSTTVHRIWRDHKLKPHQVRSFKFSRDPQLAEKIVDVVGLYLDPPKGALVLCVDEKTQIQALDRTQPTLPMKPGKAQRMTHDYKRNGTTSLYAALEIATGEVTGACYPQHPHQEFLAFLNQLRQVLPTPAVARRARQLLHPLHPGGRPLARAPPTRPLPLHPDQCVLDEHGRDLVLDPHQATSPPRHLPRRSRTHRRDRTLHRRLQRTTHNRSSGPRPPTRSSRRPSNNKTLQKRCTSTTVPGCVVVAVRSMKLLVGGSVRSRFLGSGRSRTGAFFGRTQSGRPF